MKILVIDDEPKAAEHLARGLEGSGYQVGTAHDGRVGLQAARESDYALVISDIMMPGFDGFSMVHETMLTQRSEASISEPTII